MDGNLLNKSMPDSPLIGKKLTVLRVKGIPYEATLFDGTKVYRSRDDIIETFFMGDDSHRVKAAPYDNHFCYNVPNHIEGWALMCTCGYLAGIVGSEVYKKDASPTIGDGLVSGELVVCLHHSSYGRHADGSS